MSQQEIYTVLKNNKHKWYTVAELSRLFGHSKTTVGTNMKKLFRDGDVERRDFNVYAYEYKFSEKKCL